MSLTHSERLRRMASEGEEYDSFLASCADELERFNLIINQPENDNFVKGISTETREI